MPVRLRLRAPWLIFVSKSGERSKNVEIVVKGNAIPMRTFLLITIILGSSHALAVCAFNIEVGDGLTFSMKEMNISNDCEEITVTLKHTGNLGKSVMGHNWVLSRASDVAELAQKGIAAGLDNDYLPADDQRIIAATKIIGSGEETNISFDPSILSSNEKYIYFCSFPGHSFVMKGNLSVL